MDRFGWTLAEARATSAEVLAMLEIVRLGTPPNGSDD